MCSAPRQGSTGAGRARGLQLPLVLEGAIFPEGQELLQPTHIFHKATVQ